MTPFDGILGDDILKQHQSKIDYLENEIILNNVPLKFDNQINNIKYYYDNTKKTSTTSKNIERLNKLNENIRISHLKEGKDELQNICQNYSNIFHLVSVGSVV